MPEWAVGLPGIFNTRVAENVVCKKKYTLQQHGIYHFEGF